MNYPVETQHSNPFSLNLTEGPGRSVTAEVNHMIQNGSWIDRRRLRKLRSREDYAYAEEALVEMMAAKRRTITAAISLTEDYARKLLLKEASISTAAVERDIARFTTEAIRYFESEITDKVEAAYLAEMEKTLRAQALLDAKKMTKQRYDALLARIQLETDRTAHGADKTIQKILSNLQKRFETMVESGGSA